VTNDLKNLPIVVEGVQIENIDFSDAYEHSVEEAMQARVEVQKLQQQQAQQKVQAETTVINAKAKAEAQVAQAEAEAQSIRLRGEAEAAAIKARGDALRDNPGLVALTQAEKWDGKLPTTMLPNGTVPIINAENTPK
jgi:regulator of protease activity HflC (stomatin/prohibitin superfamily)